MHTKLQSGSLKGRAQLGDLDVDGRIILKLILSNYGVRVWTDSTGSCDTLHVWSMLWHVPELHMNTTCIIVISNA
jgi:hypothetical protein